MTSSVSSPGGLRMVLGDIRAGGRRSLADSLASELRQAIRDGRLPARTRLPASRSLAADLEVSRGVVVRSYEQLLAEGYLLAQPGSGTIVGEVHAAAGHTSPSVERFTPANPGVPALGWFPRRAWLAAYTAALTEVPDADLGYGDPRGHPRLRQALAAYLGRTRAVVADVDQIVVTTGFAQGLRLAAEALRSHGIGAIGVEDPGSVGSRLTLEAGGLTIRAVPVDQEGLDVTALAGGGVDAVCVTPAHQFPTGAVLSPGRRAALLDWVAQAGRVVIEDDYDAEYRYDAAPVGALQGLAPEQVVYGGSVSKTLAPGLRLGWLVVPSWLGGAVVQGKLVSDFATPVLEQVALATFIQTGGLDRHIRRMSARYLANRDALTQAIATRLPEWTVSGVSAGMHAVLTPPDHIDPSQTTALAEHEAALRVLPISTFSVECSGRGLVIGYGNATPDQIRGGIAALSTRMDSLPRTQ